MLLGEHCIDFLPFAPVPVIKKTWEKDALFLEYYSDHADPSIPTINIGVPNTERGKCLLLGFRVGCLNAGKRKMK